MHIYVDLYIIYDVMYMLYTLYNIIYDMVYHNALYNNDMMYETIYHIQCVVQHIMTYVTYAV